MNKECTEAYERGYKDAINMLLSLAIRIGEDVPFEICDTDVSDLDTLGILELVEDPGDPSVGIFAESWLSFTPTKGLVLTIK